MRYEKKIAFLAIVVGILGIFATGCTSDGKCRRCGKEGEYQIGGDWYCEKHYLDVLGEVMAWDGD